MVRMPWVTYLWPGLPQLWRQGLWVGLALAVGFGVLLNGLLMASLVWVELLSPGMLRAGWLVTGGIWLASAVTSAWYGWGVAPRRAHSVEAMFREAQSEYLQGKWFEAEQILGRLLEIQPRDVEARLMLATLLKHNGRLSEAAEQLRRLELLQDARTWALEIEVEKQTITDLAAEQQEMQVTAENAGFADQSEHVAVTSESADEPVPHAA
jgi:hypothetical protein